jgi:uncharacterized protein YcbK (DUF882 family)
MNKLAKNFSKSEFECKCGCEMPNNVLENIKLVAEQLQIVRSKLNKPIKINSAYRCESHNESIGGSKNSQHLLGLASDIVVESSTPNKLFIFLNKLMALNIINLGGLGQYNTFTHIDFRGFIARWDNRGK